MTVQRITRETNSANVSRTLRAGRSSERELACLGILLAFYGAAYLMEGVVTPAAVNVMGCSALIVILFFGNYNLLAAQPHAIWGALFWFRVVCAIYFGIGGMAPYIANDTTLNSMLGLYRFTDEEVLHVNAINAAAILCVLSGAAIWNSLTRGGGLEEQPGASGSSLIYLALVFLIVGGIARYGVVVPVLFGFTEGILPAMVSSVAKVYSAGLMLLVLIGLRTSRPALVVAFILVLIELSVGILSFNKGDVLITLLFVILAFYHARPTIYRLIAGLVVAIGVFIAITPLVSFGRAQIIPIGGGQQVATLERRIEIVSAYLDGEATELQDAGDFQAPLNRISYVNAETMVVAWYHQGYPGDTLKYAFAAFIPRVLWPDKPSLTSDGTDLYTAATGDFGTSISAGLFAEAYWNFGWLGLPILLVPFGAVLAFLTSISLQVVSRDSWIYLPVVLLSVQVGTRVDGAYVPDVIGASFTIFVMYLFLRAVEFIQVRRRV